MEQGDPEAALLPISTAIDATATRRYGKRGRKSYKDWLHENLELITRVALGSPIFNLRLNYKHPYIEEKNDGLCGVEDILYHVVRCGLAHDARLPSNLIFTKDSSFEVRGELIVMPSSLVYGLIVAVIVCRRNANEFIRERYRLELGDNKIKINKLWGKREPLDILMGNARGGIKNRGVST